MSSVKRCPQCGKNVPADRTYCMHCGVTLGVRCPGCQAVSPVGSKVCADCGHSFVQKKKHLRLPIRKTLRRYAKPILVALPILLLILTLIAASNPTVSLFQTVNDIPRLHHELSGFDLMGYFLSGEPDSIRVLLAERELEELLPALQALLFGAGVGWMILLAGLILGVCLVACNIKKLGRETARRMFWPLGLSLGGALAISILGRVITTVLVDALASDVGLLDVVVLETAAVFPIVLLAVVAVAFLLQVVLYIDTFRHREEADEWSLSRIFHVPFALLGRALRKLGRKLSKRSKKAATEDDEPFLTTTPRFSSFLILFGIALVFTQALLSKISNIFFWFMFFLPLVMLVYVLLASRALDVDNRTETVTTEKNTPQTYEFRIGNRSILALPFIEARLSIPQSNSVRCTERLVRLSMAPLTGYTMKNTVTFRFRGTYDIGVRYFYIYDFFRLFRVRVNVESMATVYVMPRRMTPDDALAQAISDSTVRTVRSPLVVDKLEVSDIRDYRNGDSLKSIHWKLSSKSETFIVKDYNTGTANQTVVFCDLAPHFPDEPPVSIETVAAEEPERRSNKASRKERRAEVRLEADRRAKNVRVREDRDTHAITDDDLRARLDARATVAGISDAQSSANTVSTDREVADGQSTTADTAAAIPSLSSVITAAARREQVNVHELSEPVFYEDMNEYLADGVVELTIAMVLSELRQGHEVMLLWFDRRAESGICAYSLRSIDEFESIYHLFATAPLCDLTRHGVVADYDVTALTAMTSQLQSVKQLFVVPTMDTAMLSGLTSLPGIADTGNAGSTEVVLYTPEERFKYPAERTAYIESCREQLSGHGISLTAGSFNISPPAPIAAKGGASHEA